MTKKCIDLSYWQDNISVDGFKKVKTVCDAAIIRASYTSTGVRFKMESDSRFVNNLKNAHEAGLICGAYHFSQSKTVAEAEKEANYICKILEPYKDLISFYVAYDCEFNKRFTSKYGSKATEMANAFCKIIKDNGYYPVVYANYTMLTKYMKTKPDYPIWVAQYPKTYKEGDKSAYTGKHVLWQYTSSGSVPGISGRVDLSCLYEFPVPEEKKGYSGEFPSMILKKTTQEVIDDTCKWSEWIAATNDFHYGYTSKDGKINAHHNGCYFCGTNGKQKDGMKMKEYTYCCNPFVHAAWAHGGCVPSMLTKCRKGSSFGFLKGQGYDKSTLFQNLGHPDMSKLKKGDVLCNDHHVVLYVGNGYITEAGTGDDNVPGSKKWNNSIHKTKMSKSTYNGFKRVHRYIKSVDTSGYIGIGEISDRVKLLQKFLNWYGDYGLSEDRCFYKSTKNAVIDFQKKEGIVADGKFGTNSLAKAKAVKK